MRDRSSTSAFLALIWTGLAACGASHSSVDAAKPVDDDDADARDAANPVDADDDADALDAANPADADDDAGALDAASSNDVATGMDGPTGFFIVGDIDGQTWLATYNIMPVANNFLAEVATVEPSPPSREWQFNFTLPDDPLPYTLECVGNYIEFHEIGLNPERRFVSRTATSHCEVTFVEPTVPGTIEGTFTANLTLRGTTMDYLVTNGRFRLPRAP